MKKLLICILMCTMIITLLTGCNKNIGISMMERLTGDSLLIDSEDDLFSGDEHRLSKFNLALLTTIIGIIVLVVPFSLIPDKYKKYKLLLGAALIVFGLSDVIYALYFLHQGGMPFNPEDFVIS